ncbi:MAG: hypothetical protein RBR99_05500 [Dehalococcoidales bacterium]|jgi:hypothetical protein|nr:hypothetical protein [Dehalococcoidales bacterium]MDX9986890.1 hypothetical protein [Dehalococcoidales bacterium]
MKSRSLITVFVFSILLTQFTCGCNTPKGEDPRNNPDVLASLEEAGKLIEKLSIAEIDILPRGFKGYELYSWPKEEKWMFTLITGTNRTKTVKELTTVEDYISETGWVNIHCSSVDDIQTALSKLPAGELVVWCGELHIGETEGVDFKLPPEQIVGDIKTHCEALGLDLVVGVG